MSLKSIGCYAYWWASVKNQYIQLNFKSSYDTEQSKLPNILWSLLSKEEKSYKKVCWGQLKYCLLYRVILYILLTISKGKYKIFLEFYFNGEFNKKVLLLLLLLL